MAETHDETSAVTRGPGRFARAYMSAIAVLIIYGNLAVTFNPEKFGRVDWPALPRPFAIHDAFLIPGMFSGYVNYNFDFVLMGERTQQGRPRDRGEWIELPYKEHFPLRYPIVYTQLFAAHHWDMLGQQAQRDAWAALSVRIKAHHNRLHPDAPIDRLQIGSLNFPLSPLGYRGAKTRDATRAELWYGDP
ncbi:MAG TPA: hypothetical protein VGI70_09070 [Polyangiales bacterium]